MIVADILRTLAAPAQTNRLIQLHMALPGATLPDALVVESFSGEEDISALGGFAIDCVSVSTHWPLQQLIDKEVTLRLLQADGRYRQFHGYVHQAHQLGADGGLARYRVQLMPWLAFLKLRHDCYVFQDQSLQAVLTSVFSEYPQAKYRFEVSPPCAVKPLCTQFNESDLDFVERLLAEQGWSYRFEHDQQGGSDGASAQAHHTLVIFDSHSPLPTCAQSEIRFHRSAVTERSDAVSEFSEHVHPVSTQVTVQSFDDRALVAVVGQASVDLSAVIGNLLPAQEVFIDASPGLYTTAQAATEAAQLVQDAIALKARSFRGVGSVRALQAGTRFNLTQHQCYLGTDDGFAVTRVRHHACNNLGSDAATLLNEPALKDGTYRNEFEAVPAAAPLIIPASGLAARLGRNGELPVGPLARPREAQLDTAIVVGIEGEAITTTREHRIKLQFAWQRGQRPNAGGLTVDHEYDSEGRAPGNEQSGIWVRVSELLAGPNYGSVFVPRIGSEVVVEYLHGDIDCPLVTGQLYNGEDLPPFSAGEGSSANHPGVLSGVHTQGLNHANQHNQWQSDITPGQLRTRVLSSEAHSELNLGYLIDQPPNSSMRGAYRGQGAELRTDGWLVTRMGEGLLISATARPDQGYSATGSTMDVEEAVAQLKGGHDLQQRLDDAAASAQALRTVLSPLQTSIKSIDLKQQGHYEQAEKVPKFAAPHLMLDTPDDRLNATPSSLVQYAAGHVHHVTQGHRHDSNTYTHSQVSGGATSLFAQQGGISIIAANGEVTVQAHDGNISGLSGGEMTVISVNGEIEILAPNCIRLEAGGTFIELNGSNVTMGTSGAVDIKANLKQVAKGLSGGTALPTLPMGRVTVPKMEGVPPL